MGMNWYSVIAGAISLFIGWQFSQAYMIGASIWYEEGFAVRIIHRGNRSYSQHLFNDDRAVLSRG